ncbi:MAG: RimK family protein [Granulosicoccaceae bacterium]|jgi:glutathione synthase/RimK-type ligase-like ATP-grasp enzyme
MSTHIVLVENPRDWPANIDGIEVVTAREYLDHPEKHRDRGLRIINLCRGYRYLSTGYYCSLLAEARHHRIVPSIRTITDLASKAIYSLNVEDLDRRVEHALKRHAGNSELDHHQVFLFFGKCEHRELQDIGRQLFDLFPVPILRVEFKRQQRWQISSIRALSLHQLHSAYVADFDEALHGYLASRWRSRRRRQQAYYDFAILYNPDEKLPPSNMRALRKFIDAGKKLGADVELITKKDYGRLAEFDALLIRETTNIGHHTYRFSRKAEEEGLVVIDDPDSIVKCTNKVYLAELLKNNGVPIPRTVILRRGDNIDIEQQLGLPVVLKVPDGSFSRGVYKANSVAEFNDITARLFRESDLILAQEYLYTEFDWRIGILNNEVLFACHYLMSPKHWQIVRHGDNGKAVEGAYRSIPLDEVPEAILAAAKKSAQLIGDGLYGVDLKEIDGRVYVIEVNDNPNIETDVEDKIPGMALYSTIIKEMIRRIDLFRKD